MLLLVPFAGQQACFFLHVSVGDDQLLRDLLDALRNGGTCVDGSIDSSVLCFVVRYKNLENTIIGFQWVIFLAPRSIQRVDALMLVHRAHARS